jgi:hypothetical protein
MDHYAPTHTQLGDAVMVPVRIDEATGRISGQWVRIKATLIRPAIIGSSVGQRMICQNYKVVGASGLECVVRT